MIKPELEEASGRLRLQRTAGWRKYAAAERKEEAVCQEAEEGQASWPTSPAKSHQHKMDLMRLRMSSYKEMRKCCALLLTETWLNNMPDAVYQIERLLFFRVDSNQPSGKIRGGGLGASVNKHWCTKCNLVSSHCSEAVEYLTLNTTCRGSLQWCSL